MSACEILDRLQAGGIHVALRGNRIGVSPREKVTPAIKETIVQERAEIIALLREGRTWPESRGRDGVLRDPAAIWDAVGKAGRLQADRARVGVLFAVSLDTRTGALRCRLRFADGGQVTAWPEEVEIEDPDS